MSAAHTDAPLAGLARHPFDAVSFGLGLVVTILGLSLVSSAADWPTISVSWALPAGLVFLGTVLLVTTLRQTIRTGGGSPDAADQDALDLGLDDGSWSGASLEDLSFEFPDDTAVDGAAVDGAAVDDTALDDTALDDTAVDDTVELEGPPAGPGRWPDEDR